MRSVRSRSPVERLHVPVLPRTPLGNEQCLHTRLGQPTSNGTGHELRAVVTSQMTWRAADVCQFCFMVESLFQVFRLNRFSHKQ